MAVSSSGSGAGLRKALFQSPFREEDTPKSSDALEALLNKIQVDVEVDSNLNGLKREIHQQSLTKLRQELEVIKQEQWRYQPIDQLIGF